MVLVPEAYRNHPDLQKKYPEVCVTCNAAQLIVALGDAWIAVADEEEYGRTNCLPPPPPPCQFRLLAQEHCKAALLHIVAQCHAELHVTHTGDGLL